MQKKIAILGAGPAGLGLAHKLLDKFKDAEIIIFEKTSCVGGLAASFEKDELIFDYGSHRLHPATSPEILHDLKNLLGKELLDRPRNGRIRLLNKFVRFPLNPMDLAFNLPTSFVKGILTDTVVKTFRKKRNSYNSFAEFLLAGLGPTVCHNFYFPYARKIWGLDPYEISVTQAELRVSANNFTKLIKKLLSKLPGIGSNSAGRFYYPRKGFGQISEILAKEVRKHSGKICLSHELVPYESVKKYPQENLIRIKLNNDIIFHVIQHQELTLNAKKAHKFENEIEVDFVFSTIPITSLAECIYPPPPSEILSLVNRIQYRAMVLLYLIIEVDRFRSFDAHYFPGDEVIFSRISEPKCYYDGTIPKGLTGLCLEIPCTVGDEIWSADDSYLLDLVLKQLANVDLPIEQNIRNVFSKKLPSAYPIYNIGYELDFTAVDQYFRRIERFVGLGRQALFMHNNTHHSLEMAYRAIDCLGLDLKWDNDRWDVYRNQFASQVVED